ESLGYLGSLAWSVMLIRISFSAPGLYWFGLGGGVAPRGTAWEGIVTHAGYASTTKVMSDTFRASTEYFRVRRLLLESRNVSNFFRRPELIFPPPDQGLSRSGSRQYWISVVQSADPLAVFLNRLRSKLSMGLPLVSGWVFRSAFTFRIPVVD